MTERAPGNRLPPTDGDLLSRLYTRDVAAFEQLYDRHAGYVCGLARRMLGKAEEAEEVTQDVFWQLWKGRIRYDPERGRFTTWLFAIARSRCLDRLRSHGARPAGEPLPGYSPPAPENPEQDVYAAERRQQVKTALGGLPAEQRRAIEMCFYQGLSHREIARSLNEPLGTVKSRIRMGMDKLKLSLRGFGGT